MKKDISHNTILIVSVDFPPHTDGVSTVSHELATRLAEAGEDIIVIGPKAKGDREYDSRQKFKVIRTPWYELGYIRFMPILFVMPYVILRYRIKRVIAMNIAYGGIIAYLFSLLSKFNYSLWAYGFEFAKFENNRFMKCFYVKIYQKADFIAAITNYVSDRLVKFGVSPEKIVLIKPGTDPLKYYPAIAGEDFRKRHGLGNKRVILSVGRLIERKGFDMTIRAMKDVLEKHPEALYVMVGTGPFKERLQNLAEESGVGNAVRFTGRISNEDLLSFYNACDLFIMPSRILSAKGDIEGYGIVYLEANACGKPAIGGLDGGMSEAIEHGVTGLLVNSYQEKEISAAIIKILSSPEYAKKLGENGRKKVIEELNWDKAVKLFHQYFKDKQ